LKEEGGKHRSRRKTKKREKGTIGVKEEIALGKLRKKTIKGFKYAEREERQHDPGANLGLFLIEEVLRKGGGIDWGRVRGTRSAGFSVKKKKRTAPEGKRGLVRFIKVGGVVLVLLVEIRCPRKIRQGLLGGKHIESPGNGAQRRD